MGVFERTDRENMLQELGRIFGADDRVTGMIPDTEGDPSNTASYGGQYYQYLAPIASRRLPLVSGLVNTGRQLFRPNGPQEFWRDVKDGYTRGKEDFIKGVSLADDSTEFIDKPVRLADGTIGSEERVRGYKGEGLKAFGKGIGYGMANIPDAVLGLAVDEDNILRAPTQGIKHALEYEPTGDEEVDSALSAMHTMGSIVGESAGTYGTGKLLASLAQKGVRTLAPHVPHMVDMPESVKAMIPNSAYNMMGRVPHIENVLKTKRDSDIYQAVADGLIDVATIYQIAKEENWGSEELETALGLAAVAGSGFALVDRLPKTRDWTPSVPTVYPKKPPAPTKDSINPHVARLESNKKGIVRDKYNSPKFILPKKLIDPKTKEPYPWAVVPYQMGKGYDAEKKELRRSQAFLDAEKAEKARYVHDIHNEEIDVQMPQSLTGWPKNAYIRKHGEIPPVPNDPKLSPNDSLILGKELKRVFGKRSQVDEVGDNAFRITLPNGIELNARTETDIRVPSVKAASVRKQYDLPKRTLFKLKGYLDEVDSEALIRLSSLHDIDTVQHEAVHFALNTVTTRKEKQMLEELFGANEEKQVAGIMQAIAEERTARAEHPMPLMRTVLRKIENLGGYVKAFAENVPTAIAKRNLSYLEGRPKKDILRDYAESFVDGSVWGRDIAPVMREMLDRNREEIMDFITKNHSRYFTERDRFVMSTHSPNIMSLVTQNNAPLVIDNSILDKVLLEKHGDSIRPEHIARLNEELERPMLIIDGMWKLDKKKPEARDGARKKLENTYDFVLGMEDKNQANILVPIGIDYTLSGNNSEKVNKVKSMYGYTTRNEKAYRMNIDDILTMVKHKGLAYVDKDKVLEAVRKHKPEEFENIRNYLDKELPPNVHTVESYREYRKRRGMKPIRESRD